MVKKTTPTKVMATDGISARKPKSPPRTKAAKRNHASQAEPHSIEEQLAQRNAELAILNSVGEAMAKTLDVRTVTKIVGDKVRDIFNCEIVGIRLLDPSTN